MDNKIPISSSDGSRTVKEYALDKYHGVLNQEGVDVDTLRLNGDDTVKLSYSTIGKGIPQQIGELRYIVGSYIPIQDHGMGDLHATLSTPEGLKEFHVKEEWAVKRRAGDISKEEYLKLVQQTFKGAT